MKKFRAYYFPVALAVIIMFGAATGALGAQPKTVLVLPFKMNAPQELLYLQQGIQEMLATRLAWEDKVATTPLAEARNAFKQVKGDLDEEAARALGKTLRADYVLFGSLTVIGESASLDARLVDLTGSAPPVSSSVQSPNLDGIIPKVSDFADQINKEVFGRGATTTAAGTEESDNEAPYRRHPDYLLTGLEGQTMSPLNPNFIAAIGSDSREGAFWRSPSFPVRLMGMAVADLDGDNRNELIIGGWQRIYVGRVENGTFTKLATYDAYGSDRYLSMDVYDANGNGRPEIIINNQRNFKPCGIVLEMEDGKLKPIADNLFFYMRLVETPNGEVLLGQRSGMGLALGKTMHRVEYAAGQYSLGERFMAPRQVNIFNFAAANLTESAEENYIVVDQDQRMSVYSLSGEDLWTSKDTFAGTENYIEEQGTLTTASEISMKDGDEARRFWISARIRITDLNDDGHKEVLVPRNEGTLLTGLLSIYRGYRRGALMSLDFIQMSMRENWRTRDLPGAIVDYQIADYDNDGRKDLIVGVSLKVGGGLSESRCAVVAYELATPEEMRDATTKKHNQ